MDLRRLRLFVAVVDHGGFTSAARAVHVAQPAISLAVRELETELGATLLVRSRQGVALTPAGLALEAPARQALRDVDTARAAVAEVTGLTGGHLDVAALPTLAPDPTAPLVGAFRAEHPGVTVRLAALDTPEELAAWVRAGRAEVGITERGPANRGLVERALQPQDLVAVGPPGSGPPGRPLSLRRLSRVPLVLTTRGSSLRDLVDEALAAAGVEPVIAVETSQREALVPLVMAGAGTTFVPHPLGQPAAAIGAVVRPLSPRIRRQVVLAHRPGALSPAARALAGDHPAEPFAHNAYVP